ncbi:MAG: tetratricopeptide repeat protein [Pseudomonadota bacterium]
MTATQNQPTFSAQVLGHPLSWLVITLIGLALAYAWISQLNKVPEVAAARKLVPEAVTTSSNDLIVVEKQEAMAITQPDDSQRAAEYLEFERIQSEIAPLLQAAEEKIIGERYVLPDGDNAWYYYQRALEIDPRNNDARSGQTAIINRLIDNAETSIEAGEFADAENYLVQLDLIQPDDPLQNELREDIKTQIALEAKARQAQQLAEDKKNKIAQALQQADQEKSNSPINYNKLRDLYNLVIELDPENNSARSGLTNVADLQLDEIEKLLTDGELDAASTRLAIVSRQSPDNKRIGSLKIALDASIEKREAAEIARQNQAAAEAARQAAELQNAAELSDAPPETTEATVTKEATESAESPAATTVAQNSPDSSDTPSDSDTETVTETLQAVNQTEKLNRLQDGIRAYYAGDYSRSFELLYPLAEEGVARAQFRIGIMYRYGRSVTQNNSLSEKWFTSALPVVLRAAQQGDAWAQTDLGTAYEMGISLQQNYERAAMWYLRAARQGYPGAQTNLGVLYATGEGVSYDRAKAVEWLKKAASQGDIVAAENLRIMGADN